LKPYRIIKDYYPSPVFKAKMEESIKGLQGSVENLPGMKIMNSLPKPVNFQQLFDSFVAFISQQQNGYKWDGTVRRGEAEPILDGELKQTECGAFAGALVALAQAPPPFGLGLPKSDVTKEPYYGRDKGGFVSLHPAGGILGLHPNVNAMGGHALGGEGLYFWDSHKVVKYQNRFYDVMYDTTYPRLEDMALYHVLDNQNAVSLEQFTYYQVEPTQVHVAGGIVYGRKGYWFKKGLDSRYAGPSESMPF